MQHQQLPPQNTLVPYTPPAALQASKPAYPDPQNFNNAADDLGLLEYWRIIRRYKGTVILVAIVGGILGFLVTLPQTPIYQARTSIEIVGLNENFMNIKEVNPVSQTGGTSEMTDIQTQIRILQSESLIERVLSKLQAPDSSTTVEQAPPTRIQAWRKALNLPEPSPADQQEQALAVAAKNLKVRAAGQTRLIEITVDSPNPNTAASFANTLATEFIEQNLESRWQTTEKTSEWLTRQLDEMRIKLERSEDKLQEYARQAGLLFTQDNKTNVSEDKLRQIQTSLTTAQADRVSKQSRYEMAIDSPPEALPDVLNDTSLRDYQSKLTDLKRQVAELTSTYTAEYPKVKRVQAQMATLEAALLRERNAILRRIKNEYDEAVRKEKLLNEDYASQAARVTGEGEKSIQYNILKREVDSNRQLYDTMLQQLKQATLASALRASNIRVVDHAKVPNRPYKPSPRQSAGVGMLAGTFLAVALVIMRDRADRTIQQPGDAPYFLNIPELGIIPAADVKQRLKLSYGRRAPNTDTALTVRVADAEERVELVTYQQRASMIAESFRSTLVSILFTGHNGNRPKVLVFTSAGPGEGKSTVTSNMAIAIAETGQKVLLIDADMRKPRLHSIFGVTNDYGLSDLLKLRNGESSYSTAIRTTDVAGVNVLPSGPSTAAAASILYGPQMAELLTALRSEYDTILIDTPPMLQISDARVLGRLADRVVLVVRANKTTRDAAIAACQRFREDGTLVMGTILNDWNASGAGGYYQGYYRQYQYEPDHAAPRRS